MDGDDLAVKKNLEREGFRKRFRLWVQVIKRKLDDVVVGHFVSPILA